MIQEKLFGEKIKKKDKVTKTKSDLQIRRKSKICPLVFSTNIEFKILFFVIPLVILFLCCNFFFHWNKPFKNWSKVVQMLEQATWVERSQVHFPPWSNETLLKYICGWWPQSLVNTEMFTFVEEDSKQRARI